MIKDPTLLCETFITETFALDGGMQILLAAQPETIAKPSELKMFVFDIEDSNDSLRSQMIGPGYFLPDKSPRLYILRWSR